MIIADTHHLEPCNFCIKKSKIHVFGVFANKDIVKNSKIIYCDGEEID